MRQALLLGRVDLVLDRERRGLRAVEDGQRSAFTSIAPVFILGFTLAPRLTTLPRTPMQNSQAQRAGELVGLGGEIGLEDDLGQALAVAQVDEHRAAVIAPVVHPAEEDDLLADVRGVELRRRCGSA